MRFERCCQTESVAQPTWEVQVVARLQAQNRELQRQNHTLSERAARPDDTSGVTVVRPIAHDPTVPETTRIMPAERTSVSERPEIRQYVLPTVYTNNGSLIDVFA